MGTKPSRARWIPIAIVGGILGLMLLCGLVVLAFSLPGMRAPGGALSGADRCGTLREQGCMKYYPDLLGTDMSAWNPKMAGLSSSADGSLLLGVSTRQDVCRVLESASGEVRLEFQCSPESVYKLSPDGKFVLEVTTYGQVTLIDVATDGGRQLAPNKIEPIPDMSFFWDVTGLVSPDGSLVAAVLPRGEGQADSEVAFFHVQDGKPAGSLRLDGDLPLLGAFSPDGEILATSDDAGIRFWRVADLSPLPVSISGENAFEMVFSPDASLLATTVRMGEQVKIWEVASGKLVRTIDVPGLVGGETYNSFVFESYRLAFSPDGKLLSLGNYYGLIVRVSNGSLVAELPRMNDDTNSHFSRIVFSPDGRWLYFAFDNHVFQWKAPAEK
jgi:WD40 repeat protein